MRLSNRLGTDSNQFGRYVNATKKFKFIFKTDLGKPVMCECCDSLISQDTHDNILSLY